MNTQYRSMLMFFLGVFIQGMSIIYIGNVKYNRLPENFFLKIVEFISISILVFALIGIYFGFKDLIVNKKFSIVSLFGVVCNLIWFLFFVLLFVIGFLGIYL